MSKVIKLLATLDLNVIISGVEPTNLTKLSKLEVFKTIDSTNSYLLEKSKIDNSSGQICFAEEQTHGRGRRDRAWFSPASGNIYCSILWDFGQSDISGLSLVVGIILLQALQRYGIDDAIMLKWPNDLIYQNRKLGGILLECRGTCVVIGIGINLSLPEQRDQDLIANSVDLAEISQKPVERNMLAGILVNELLFTLPQFAEHGFSIFLAKWQTYDALMNKEVFVHTPEKIFFGKMQGINERGELLLLDEQQQLKSFCYGEVTVRAA